MDNYSRAANFFSFFSFADFFFSKAYLSFAAKGLEA